jgi:hypothetical protein
VIEIMMHHGQHSPHDAHAALYTLLAGAEGCGPAARSARLAQDDEFADSLCKVQGDIVREAGKLLGERMAE